MIALKHIDYELTQSVVLNQCSYLVFNDITSCNSGNSEKY